MRIRHRTVLVCGSMLLAGALLGSVINSLRLISPSTAHAARPADHQAKPDEANHLGGKNTLFDCSRLLSRIASHTTPSVVHIQAEHRERGKRVEETGSGVLIRKSGHPTAFVVTNSHVIRGASYPEIEVRTASGRIFNPSRVLEDRSTDIALLELPARDLPYAVWGDSDQADIGHVVLAMGSPFGLSQSVTFGIISAKGRRDLQLTARRDVINQDFLQTDAAINPGNSGGPLIDLHGKIVGINTAIASNSGGNEGIGFSIPSNLVRHVVEQLLSHGRVRRAYLGVKLDDEFNARTAARLGLDHTYGARIVEVYREPETPASRAGLAYDDVVLTFNGVEVMDENHLINLVSLADVNTRARLIIQRNRRRFAVEVTLTERESQPRAEDATPRRVPASPSALTTESTEEDATISGLVVSETSQGLLVREILDGALSDHIQPFDVIVEANGRRVTSVEQTTADLAASADGRTLLKVRRIEGGRDVLRFVTLP